MEKNNIDDVKNVVINLRTLRDGNRFAYDLFDADGNKIVDAHKPLTSALLNHLISSGTDILYYDPASSPEIATDSGLNAEKGVISDATKQKTIDQSRDIFEQIREQLNYNPSSSVSRGLVDSSRDLISGMLHEIDENEDGTFSVITELKNLDEFYYVHSTNVSIMGALLGSRLDFKTDVKSAIGVGGLFHDIGLTSVNKDILAKLEKSEEDIDSINLHPHVGYKLVEKNQHLQELEKRILLLHHEKCDGSGYPFGFDVDQIKDSVPREVRLMAIIDTYVSLTQTMPNVKALSSRDALRKMLNMIYAPYKKEHSFLFDDFRDFIRALGFIINGGNFFMQHGDLVRMNTGEVGIIEEMSTLFPMNPKVRIVKNSKLETMKRPILVDMLKDYKSYISNVFDRTKNQSQSQ